MFQTHVRELFSLQRVHDLRPLRGHLYGAGRIETSQIWLLGGLIATDASQFEGYPGHVTDLLPAIFEVINITLFRGTAIRVVRVQRMYEQQVNPDRIPPSTWRQVCQGVEAPNGLHISPRINGLNEGI